MYGLTRQAPTACILGTLGAALSAEGITNAGLRDITEAAESVTGRAKELAGRVGFGGQAGGAAGVGSRQGTRQPATAGRR